MCGRQRDGEPEKPFDLHGLADKAIERLTSDVLDNQHRSPALAHELHRPQRPVGSEGILEFVFAGETIEALERRMLRARQDGDERVRIAPRTIASESAKRTSGLLPEHLYGLVFPASPEQGGCLHLFDLFAQEIEGPTPYVFGIRHRVESGSGRLKTRGGRRRPNSATGSLQRCGQHAPPGRVTQINWPGVSPGERQLPVRPNRCGRDAEKYCAEIGQFFRASGTIVKTRLGIHSGRTVLLGHRSSPNWAPR